VIRDAAMNQPAKAQEPSMEEILASIRRIISDDDTAQPAAAAPPPRPPAPPAARPEAARPAPVPPPAPPRPAAMPPRERVIVPEPAPTPEPAAANGASALADDILDLTEDMAAPAEPAPAPAPSFRTIDGQPDVIFTDPVGMPPPSYPPVMESPRKPQYGAPPAPADRPLLSSEASIAVDSAFNQLAQTVFTQNGHTIEDLVREMLRPMLKTWLDDNLPGLVERLVRAEIERVSRGRG
jgi:cell pole-organizing protein PopZ